MEGKDYENQVKGLDHKDQTFYANTLGDKGKASIKGTHYSDIDAPKIQTVSKDTYEARNNEKNDKNESNKSTYEYMTDKAKDILHDVAEKAKDTYNNMGNNTNKMETTAKNTFNNAEASTKNAINDATATVKNTYNAFENKAKDVINDVAGQRNPDSRTGSEKRFTTGEDVKQDLGIGSMASNIVSKVKDAAENVKEKVGNILHSVTGENNNVAKENNKFESVSGYEHNKPYATSNTSDRDVNMDRNINNDTLNKDKKVGGNVAHPRHHPDNDNIGHASG